MPFREPWQGLPASYRFRLRRRPRLRPHHRLLQLPCHLRCPRLIPCVNADATALNLETTVGGDLANVDLRATAGTVNAHAKLEVSAQAKGKSSGMSAVAGAGAEAMVVDGRVGGNISVTPKTVGDALGSVYNQVIDPVVDFVAGRDVPGIPEVPEAFDHGITASGYIEGGFGASAKLNGNISLGNGDGFKVGAGGKLGLGLVGGQGLLSVSSSLTRETMISSIRQQ